MQDEVQSAPCLEALHLHVLVPVAEQAIAAVFLSKSFSMKLSEFDETLRRLL